jgi:hypothetical protein
MKWFLLRTASGIFSLCKSKNQTSWKCCSMIWISCTTSLLLSVCEIGFGYWDKENCEGRNMLALN